jgi:hypothetical protein
VTVVIIFAVAFLLLSWVTFMGIVASRVKVYAKIYSPSDNVGVLNEPATFNVTIQNPADSSDSVNLVVNVENHTLLNETVVLSPHSTKNSTINEQLLFLGEWKIQCFEQKNLIGGYSFVTVMNKGEADMDINQFANMRLTTYISIGAFGVSIFGLIVSIIALRKKKSENGLKR